MKNINALKNFKGNNIVKLGEKLLALKTNRPHENFFLDFNVQVKTDYGSWCLDTNHPKPFHRIGSVDNWRWDVAWHLAYLDKDTPNGWDEFIIQPHRHNNHYQIDVLLRQKTTHK